MAHSRFAPIRDGMDVFFRGLLNYFDENPNQNENFVVDDYALLNLYAGIRAADGRWEVSVFGRNVTNTGKTVSLDSIEITSAGGVGNFFRRSGYFFTEYTPPREVGVSVRYAFGAR